MCTQAATLCAPRLQPYVSQVSITRERMVHEYDFLNRLRPNEENCTLVHGTFYPSTCATCLDDCVVEYGTMEVCALPSREARGSPNPNPSPSPNSTWSVQSNPNPNPNPNPSLHLVGAV